MKFVRIVLDIIGVTCLIISGGALVAQFFVADVAQQGSLLGLFIATLKGAFGAFVAARVLDVIRFMVTSSDRAAFKSDVDRRTNPQAKL